MDGVVGDLLGRAPGRRHRSCRSTSPGADHECGCAGPGGDRRLFFFFGILLRSVVLLSWLLPTRMQPEAASWAAIRLVLG